MAETNEQMLRHAIARNAAAVLSLPSAGMLRHHKTRFLGECADGLGPGADGLWIEAPYDDAALLDELMSKSEPVGMSFKGGFSSVVFTAPIRRRLEEFTLNVASEQSHVPALLLPFPREFKALQRRAAYRVTLPLENQLAVRMWRIPEHAVLRDRPMAAAEVEARVRDLSVAGMGFLCPPKNGKPPQLIAGQRLRVSLKFAEHEVLIDARLIHLRLVGDNTVAAGMQFKKLERDIEGRQTLAKLTAIVGRLQREELQRRSGEVVFGAG